MSELNARLADIELIIFDVDGVMTDGTVWIDVEGRESIRFNIQDAYGIFRGYHVNLQYAIISGRKCEAVEHRARVLRITQVYQGQSVKQEAFEKILAETGLNPDKVAYVGDDLNDLPIMKQVGVSCSVANGRPEVREAADMITEARGGEGAIRELIEMIISAKGGIPGS
jgi:3-deoxy-D-manno-octulosonate 8-phosphate phosphatase (KDO 8-P phosphatase)